MHISKFRVRNYKSYLKSPELSLTTGINLITGQNNAGKTALLEALTCNFMGNPHRSLKTLPTTQSSVNLISQVEIEFTASRDEIREIISVSNSQIFIPQPPNELPLSTLNGVVMNDDINAYAHELAKWLFSMSELPFKVRICKGPLIETLSINPIEQHFPCFGIYQLNDQLVQNGNVPFFSFRIQENGDFRLEGGVSSAAANEFGISKVVPALLPRIYSFKAERFNAGQCSFGNSDILLPDASNLAEVLNCLQGNKLRFKKFNALVQQILPQVKDISVRPHPAQNGLLQILVWNHSPETQRSDLAVPLNECGTGIGQVLAILYVVLNSDYSRTIIIDEPQSFLHRGAARKLIEILKQNTQHQFIISTHSPTIISAANPSTITLVRQEEGRSTFSTLNAQEIEQQRSFLAEIGAKTSDVFGADNILWVEGDTEEICFPLILEKLSEHSLMGTIIKGLSHTGDLEGKHARLVFDIYENLSHSKSLLPPALGFILDDEGRSPEQKKELQKLSKERVFFLPRCMYENYLLNSTAVAAVANDIEGFRDTPITSEEIEKWFTDNHLQEKYKTKLSDPNWKKSVHGANLLADLFTEFSETRVKFDKKTHGARITKWLLKNKSDELREIAELIEKVLNRQ